MNSGCNTFFRIITLGPLSALLSLVLPCSRIAVAQTVLYNRDVRPILADKCFHCHGPDAAARQSDLRLDDRDNAMLQRGDYQVINVDNPETSELLRRVASHDPDIRMPPPDSGPALSSTDVATLRQWIASGAEYQTHWSFIPPKRPTVPAVKDTHWPRNAIDNFVLAKLGEEGLRPRKAAEHSMLVRRITLDLTGLPPTIQEIDEFQMAAARDADGAYRDLVDRLLKSPRYGERMAVDWLDAARYADTNGYFTDEKRTMWPWRDWVINAFNANMPFDQFTIEQLAGDLLPNASTRQKIATGFNRNHMVNNETGIIEEEFRVEYVVDRVDTTATVWMGLTVACARCHDHKYDPISQKDFYRFFAFFNNVPERGLSGSSGNSAPLISVPTDEQRMQLTELNKSVTAAQKQFEVLEKELSAAQQEWERTAVNAVTPASEAGVMLHDRLEPPATATKSIGPVDFVEGISGKAVHFDGDAAVELENVADFGRTDAFSIGAWVNARGAGCVFSKMDDANDMRGFDLTLRKGKALVNLVHGWKRDAIQIVTASSVPGSQWHHFMVTYDGSGRAAGLSLYVDGQRQSVEVTQDNLTRTIRNDQPLRLARRQASASLTGSLDELRVYDRTLTANEVWEIASGDLVRWLVSKPHERRSPAESTRLRSWYLTHQADTRFTEQSQMLADLRDRERQLSKSIPSTMIMQESTKPRVAFVLERGQYDQPRERVAADFPGFLQDATSTGERTESDKLNRLDLAKWLVSTSNPLTARVTVNRLWQQLFGTGLVKTVDDFGTQGEWPSHPELLDWLAIELIDSGWDLQHILKMIVTSSTYRQSSDATPEAFAADPENRLLARGPRFRMPAEMLRDNALAASGLLVERRGGASVMPYQPAGLWRDVTYDGDAEYRVTSGDNLYRRSLYTFWKRQSPPPNMQVFDAPTRETCVVERSRTNTPLQALALMNDPTFVEAARKLAERMMSEGGATNATRATFGFRVATSRMPTADELEVLLSNFREQQRYFRKRRDQAAALLSVGESACDVSLDVIDLAAWATVANMILCLDETITRR